MERDYQNQKQYQFKEEINHQFQKAFTILRDLGADVPEYILYSRPARSNEDRT